MITACSARISPPAGFAAGQLQPFPQPAGEIGGALVQGEATVLRLDEQPAPHRRNPPGQPADAFDQLVQLAIG
ncbi:hypothetical protein [Candidatus Frankia alpina]|uniref:hypothetical protein n=1 Tax=Candidatus Frankia alpina TaxID=2699483 RepID=UPI001F395C77|nr:hypothetical protein [Candidatus Frankia alpina]